MCTLWIWTWHQPRLGKSFRGSRILSSGCARRIRPALPILNLAFRGARVISMTMQLFHMTTKRGLTYFLLPFQTLKPTWSAWASLLLHFNHIWGPSFYFIPFTPPTLGGGLMPSLAGVSQLKYYIHSLHTWIFFRQKSGPWIRTRSSYHVRHEVNR